MADQSGPPDQPDEAPEDKWLRVKVALGAVIVVAAHSFGRPWLLPELSTETAGAVSFLLFVVAVGSLYASSDRSGAAVFDLRSRSSAWSFFIGVAALALGLGMAVRFDLEPGDR